MLGLPYIKLGKPNLRVKYLNIALKIIISAIFITFIGEIAKKQLMLGGLIAAIPINIALAMVWLYFEKREVAALYEFSRSAFLGLVPTLFIVFLITIILKFATQRTI